MLLVVLGGFLMALADSVPGVSGGTIAFLMGIYDDFINSLNDIASRDKEKRIKAFKFLIKLGLGWITGFCSAVLVITAVFEKNIYEISSLFLGFVLFAIPLIFVEEKKAFKGKYYNAVWALVGAVEANVKRVVMIVETKHEKDNGALETVRTLFATRTKDFITAVDEKNIIIVKEVKGTETYEDLERLARTILDTLNMEAMSKVRVALGTIVNEIKEVSRSYKEAKHALDVGKIFYSEKNVVAYNNLGIGRLIYQLPLPLCKMFIKEIFNGKTLDDFDDEILSTIHKFFENNLNVSETSRQLYIHRNTLVYRLDKLQKATNLDLRTFEDAITFKIALMVVKYMKYMERVDY